MGVLKGGFSVILLLILVVSLSGFVLGFNSYGLVNCDDQNSFNIYARYGNNADFSELSWFQEAYDDPFEHLKEQIIVFFDNYYEEPGIQPICSYNIHNFAFGSNFRFATSFILATNKPLNLGIKVGGEIDDHDEPVTVHANLFTLKLDLSIQAPLSKTSLVNLLEDEQNIEHIYDVVTDTTINNWKWSSLKETILEPGIYVVYTINSCDGKKGDIQDDEQCATRFYFDGLPINAWYPEFYQIITNTQSQTMELDILNFNHLDEQDFKIYNRYNEEIHEELITYFENDLDDNEYLCHSLGFDWEESISENNCCEDEDENFIEGAFQCIGKLWNSETTIETFCTNNEGCFFEPEVPVDGMSLQQASESRDGSDGCCGDDLDSVVYEAQGMRMNLHIPDVVGDITYDYSTYYCDAATPVVQDAPATLSVNRVSENIIEVKVYRADVQSDFWCGGTEKIRYDFLTKEKTCYYGDTSTILEPCSFSNKFIINENSFNSDLGYVDSTFSRYFCNKDYDIETEFLTINDFKKSWHWWDAIEYTSAYTIRQVSIVDFISNSENWFYCNADSLILPKENTHAISILEGQSFTEPSVNSKYSCVDLLNTFEFAGGGWSTCKYPDIGTTDDSNEYNWFCDGDYLDHVCKPKTVTGTPPDYIITDWDYKKPIPQNFLSAFIDNCLANCWLDEKRLTNSVDISAQELCDIFPNAAQCDDSGTTNDPQQLFKERCVGSGLTTNGCLNIYAPSVSEDASCEDVSLFIDEISYIGTTCAPSTNEMSYCEQGFAFNYNNTDNSVCCLIPETISEELGNDLICGYLNEDEVNELNCEELGGDWFFNHEIGENYICTGDEFVDVGETGVCCVQGSWDLTWNTNNELNSVQNESFICYNHGNNNWISECCTDFTVCNNFELAYGIGPEHYLYYGKGGITHSINNFDAFYENLPTDYIMQMSVVENKNETIMGQVGDGYRSLIDWSSFDNLEFDIALEYADETIYLVLEDSLDETEEESCKIYFNNYLVNGKSILRWHHVVVNLTEEFSKCVDFNPASVHTIKIGTDDKKVKANNPYFILLDSFTLSGGDNSPNYYCTGNFGSWVTNLDGETDEGFDIDAPFEDDEGVLGYGPYRYACEAQASLDWTGTKCCGDDTTTAFNIDQIGGEYFVDSNQGCFHGVPVPNGRPVGYALNDESINDLLYYGEKFIGCMKSVSDYTYTTKYNSTDITTNYLVEETRDEFDVIGDYVCFEGGWVNTKTVPSTKIMLAKLYELTKDNSGDQYNYELMCEDVSNLNQFEGLDTTLIQNFCVLNLEANLEADSKTYSVIALKFNLENVNLEDKTEIQYFLNNLKSNLLSQLNIVSDDIVGFENACDINVVTEETISTYATTHTNFFQTCDYTNRETDLKFAYNPGFNILLITRDESYPSDNLRKLFDTGGFEEFSKYLWTTFLNLFKWFGEGDASGNNVQTLTALLPTFHEQFAEFNKVYFYRNDKDPNLRQIQGLLETRVQENNIQKDFITVSYQGFGTEVKFLADRYYNDEQYALNYAVGNEEQVISLILESDFNPLYDYEKDFDWRRLTSGLLIGAKKDPSDNFISNQGNGIVDLGEECDTDENGENPIFREGISDCSDLNSDWAGELNCVNTFLDDSSCGLSCGGQMCSELTPLCLNDKCIQCEDDLDCSKSQSCDLETNMCVFICDEHNDCLGTPETPYCDFNSGNCVECVPSLPSNIEPINICGKNYCYENSCVECYDDNQCDDVVLGSMFDETIFMDCDDFEFICGVRCTSIEDCSNNQICSIGRICKENTFIEEDIILA